MQAANQWNAELYDQKHPFVAQFGSDLVDLLAPQAGETILDLGCGTGPLTQQIANQGAVVLGIDSAPSMIEQARKNYPELTFKVADATNLTYTEQFDAVFSNAVLHWIKEPEKAIASIYRALKPGGRFVAEFGGKGNIQAIATAIHHALQALGHPPDAFVNPWYFPSIGEYGTLLERQGLELTFATLRDRPTALEEGAQGLKNWLLMFGNSFLSLLPEEQQADLISHIENQLRPKLYQNGTWYADYRRIRVVALKAS